MIKLRLFISLLFVSLFVSGCETFEDWRIFAPQARFELSSDAINPVAGYYNAVLLLDTPVDRDITVNVAFLTTTGEASAVEGEHFTVPSHDVLFTKGSDRAILPITILDDNIFDKNLILRAVIAPSKAYGVDARSGGVFALRLSKEILTPIASIEQPQQPVVTNPYISDKFTITVNLDFALKFPMTLTMVGENGEIQGKDFFITDGTGSDIVIPADVTTHTFEVALASIDKPGIDKDMVLKLVSPDNRKLIVSSDANSFTLHLSDPILDFTNLLRGKPLSGAGYQLNQAIKRITDDYTTTVALSMDANTARPNYIKSIRNMNFTGGYECYLNGTGGDIFRLANMLKFNTTDTVIADYGATAALRFYNPTDSMLRFVPNPSNPQVGRLSAPPQKFKIRVILKNDWDVVPPGGITNFDKPMSHDSRATGGNIELTTNPKIIELIEVELVKLEGNYDMTTTSSQLLFTAWFRSSSSFFMRNLDPTYKVVKDGDMYKIEYKCTPKP